MAPPGSFGNNITVDSFEAFLQGWLLRQEQFLNELIIAQNTYDESQEGIIKNLISGVLAHYQEYFEEKSRMSHRNVFNVFSPAWFTPLEKSNLWIAGFKPGLAFSLVMNSVDDLSQNQVEKINRLKFETRVQEKNLMDELAKIQESVAAPPFMGLAQQFGAELLRGDGGEIREVDENIEILRSALEDVIMDADRLRTTTAERVVGILNPFQSLKFLTAAAQLTVENKNVGNAERSREATNANFSWSVDFQFTFFWGNFED
ncbi:PREDICTED: protein DOG1-like 4 [Nicotiana attenuata]|uniref:Transcription factor tga6 n=1 Tax=Nicotiana attenuata TaxID=49451 RepID=A0A1J6I8C3_NICAT|nr:PREDICTED: protein DOG1-like 4 [Nicotiana attenuata]OIT00762.1 transcription factor tga6 [Nicotiana attenuata]